MFSIFYFTPMSVEWNGALLITDDFGPTLNTGLPFPETNSYQHLKAQELRQIRIFPFGKSRPPGTW